MEQALSIFLLAEQWIPTELRDIAGPTTSLFHHHHVNLLSRVYAKPHSAARVSLSFPIEVLTVAGIRYRPGPIDYSPIIPTLEPIASLEREKVE